MSEKSGLVGPPQIKVCRICNQDEGLLLNIFGSDSGDTLYNQEIEKCLSIKVSRSDPCSLKVCHQCVFGLSLSCQLVETYQKTRDEFKACRATTCYLCAKSDGILSNLDSCEEPGSQSMLFKVEDCIGSKVLQEGLAAFKLCHHCHLLVDTMFNLRQKAAQVNTTIWNGLNVCIPQEDNTKKRCQLGSKAERSKVENIDDMKPTNEELSGGPEHESVSTGDIDSTPGSPAGEMDYSDGVDDYDDVQNAVDPLAIDLNLPSVNDDSVIVPKREKFIEESNSAVSRSGKVTIKKEEYVEKETDSDNDSSVAIKDETDIQSDDLVSSKSDINSENSERKCKVKLINLVNHPNFSDSLWQKSQSSPVVKIEPVENTTHNQNELLRNNLRLNHLEITESNLKSPNKVFEKSFDTDRTTDNSPRLLEETEVQSNRKSRGGINKAPNNNEVVLSLNKGLNELNNEAHEKVNKIHTENDKPVKAKRGRPKKCDSKIKSILKEKQSIETPLTKTSIGCRNITLRGRSMDKPVSKEKQNISGPVRKHMEIEVSGNKTDDYIKTTSQQNPTHSYHSDKKVKPGPRRFQRSKYSSKTEEQLVTLTSVIETDSFGGSNSEKNKNSTLSNTKQHDDFPHKNACNLPVPNLVTEKDFIGCKKNDVQNTPKRNTRSTNDTDNVSTNKSATSIINSEEVAKSRNVAGKRPSRTGTEGCINFLVGSSNDLDDKVGPDTKTYSDTFERDLLLRSKHSDKKLQCLSNWVVDLTLDNTLHWTTPVVVSPTKTVINTKANAAHSPTASSTTLQNQSKRKRKARKIDIFERVLMEAGEIVIEQPWGMDKLKNSTGTPEVPGLLKEHPRRTKFTRSLRTPASQEINSSADVILETEHQNKVKKEVSGKQLLNTSLTVTQEVSTLKERTRRTNVIRTLKTPTSGEISSTDTSPEIHGHENNGKKEVHGKGLLYTSSAGTQEMPVMKERTKRAKLTCELTLSSDERPGDTLLGTQQQSKVQNEVHEKDKRVEKRRIDCSDDKTAQKLDNQIKKRRTVKEEITSDISKHNLDVRFSDLTKNVSVRKRKRSITEDSSGEETKVAGILEADNLKYVCAVCSLSFENQVNGKIHELTHFKRPRMQLVRCNIDQIQENESQNLDLKFTHEIGSKIFNGIEAPLHSEFDDDIELQNEPCSIQGSIDCLVKKLDDDYVDNDSEDIVTNYESEKNKSSEEIIVDEEQKETTDTETIKLNNRIESPKNDSVEASIIADQSNKCEPLSQKKNIMGINYCEYSASTEIQKVNDISKVLNKHVVLPCATFNGSIVKANSSEDIPNKEWLADQTTEVLDNSNNHVQHHSKEMGQFFENNVKPLEKYIDVNDEYKPTEGMNESSEQDTFNDFDHLTCKLNKGNTIHTEENKAIPIKNMDKVIGHEGSASQIYQIRECQLNELDKSRVTDAQQESPNQVIINQPTTDMPSKKEEQLIDENVILSEQLINNGEYIVEQSIDNETAEKANHNLKEVEPTDTERAVRDYQTLKDDTNYLFKGNIILSEGINRVNNVFEQTSNNIGVPSDCNSSCIIKSLGDNDGALSNETIISKLEVVDTHSRTSDERIQPLNNTDITLCEAESNKNMKSSNAVVDELALSKKNINVSHKEEENKLNNDLYMQDMSTISEISTPEKMCTSDKFLKLSNIISMSNNKTVIESDVELIGLVQSKKEEFSKNKYNLKYDTVLTVHTNVPSRDVLTKSAGETELTKSNVNTDLSNKSKKVVHEEETQVNSDKNVLANQTDFAHDAITRTNKLDARGIPPIALEPDQANCDNLTSHNEELMVLVEKQKSTIARNPMIQNESGLIAETVEVGKTVSDSERKDIIDDLSDISDENSNDRVFFNHLEENGSDCFEEGIVAHSSNAVAEGCLSRENPSTASKITDDRKELFADDEDSNLEPKTVKVLPAV